MRRRCELGLGGELGLESTLVESDAELAVEVGGTALSSVLLFEAETKIWVSIASSAANAEAGPSPTTRSSPPITVKRTIAWRSLLAGGMDTLVPRERCLL